MNMAAVLFVACASIVEAGPLPTLVHSPRAASVLKLRGGKATTPPAAPVLPDAVKALGGAATLGSVLGYCSGAAARTAAQGVTVAVGCATGFVLLLNKFGYVTINYTKLERDVLNVLDLNKDGKVDASDYSFVSQKLVKVVSDNGLGSGAGFAAGFYAGFAGKGPF